MPDLNSPRVILELLRNAAARNADGEALVSPEEEVLSFAGLLTVVETLAAQIHAGCGSDGSRWPRVAIVLPNGLQMSVALLATAVAGEAVPLNPALTEAEHRRLWELTRIDCLLALPDDEGPAVRLARDKGLIILRLAPGHVIMDAAEASTVRHRSADDVAVVLTTSGSTGRPKIVPLTHRNLCTSAGDVARSLALSETDCCLTMWEQYHIGGVVDLLLAPLISGGTAVMAGGFDPAKFLPLVERFRPTWFQGVPTSLGALTGHYENGLPQDALRSFRFLRSVAAALTPAQLAQLERFFGVPVVRTFGMTEAGPLITSTALPPAQSKPGSVGRPAGPEVIVMGPDGQECPVGEAGEVGVRGANVFGGYEADPELNAAVFRDGWFMTGDLGYVDEDGELFLTGRAKEQINRGGFKISPLEVEDVLFSHPAIKEAAVFAVKHRTLTEDVVAAVTTRENVTQEDLQSFMKERLTRYKIPGRVLFLPDLPRNPVGKIDKLALVKIADRQLGEDFTPPRSVLEQFLKELWCKELFLSDVGIHTDFFAAGGDSLIALRIHETLEKISGRSIPDHVFEGSFTIAGLASNIGQIVAPRSRDAWRPRPRTETTTKLGTEDVSGKIGKLLKSIQTAPSTKVLNAAMSSLVTYSTPRALMDLLPLLEEVEPGGQCPKDQLQASRDLLYLVYGSKIKVLREELASATSSHSYAMTAVTPDAFLYCSANRKSQNRTLVVGFTGNLLRLQMPTYRFLGALDPARHDLLLLRDPKQSLFFRGFEGAGETLGSMSAYLSGFAISRGYGRVIALGTSGGGLAAISTALSNQWNTAIAVNAPPVGIHQEFAEPIRRASQLHDPQATRVIIVNSGNASDEMSALQMLEAIPDAEHHEYKSISGHNLLNTLHESGKLKETLEQWFAPDRRPVVNVG